MMATDRVPPGSRLEREARRVAAEILGVPNEPDPEEVRKAWRQRCKEYHPDRNRDDPQAQQRFILLECAYRLLSGTEPCEAILRIAAKRLGGEDAAERPGEKYDLDNAWGHFLWWRDRFF